MPQIRTRIVGHGEEAPDQLLAEEWRPVVGFERVYSVSNLGRIRREGGGGGSRAGRILVQSRHNAGYLSVSLWQRNKGTGALVHRLVAVAFIGPVPDGQEVNHKDGDKHNNRLENLEYVTRRDNILHACANGMMRVQGADNPMATISEEMVRAVREAYAAGDVGYKRLAKRFGLPWANIRNIVKRKTWKSVA
jgi:hypothetical protein